MWSPELSLSIAVATIQVTFWDMFQQSAGTPSRAVTLQRHVGRNVEHVVDSVVVQRVSYPRGTRRGAKTRMRDRSERDRRRRVDVLTPRAESIDQVLGGEHVITGGGDVEADRDRTRRRARGRRQRRPCNRHRRVRPGGDGWVRREGQGGLGVGRVGRRICAWTPDGSEPTLSWIWPLEPLRRPIVIWSLALWPAATARLEGPEGPAQNQEEAVWTEHRS